MNHSVLDFIAGGVRCFDGAMGTMLFQLGYRGEGCPENVDPALIRRVHESYRDSGAQFITTNTFGANRLKLANYGLEGSVREINRRNARIATDVCQNGCFVAGDIGPTGQFLKPYGEFEFEEFYAVFKEQVEALVEGGADLIIVETMLATEEVAAAIKAAKDSCSLPVFACMTFEKKPQGFRTLMGISVEAAVKAMSEAGADVIGSNCSLSPADMPALIREFHQHSKLPLLAEPNAGPPKLVDGRTIYGENDYSERDMQGLIDGGARLVGGCCGTTPDYIRRLRAVVDAHNAFSGRAGTKTIQ
jgi:5-methyltetrahydrofolate--homocysteine methyltransferase